MADPVETALTFARRIIEGGGWHDAAELAGLIEADRSSVSPRWIPVEERMPEHRRPVLVVWKGRVQWATWRFNGSVWESDLDVDDAPRDAFSHWMPLPEPPRV